MTGLSIESRPESGAGAPAGGVRGTGFGVRKPRVVLAVAGVLFVLCGALGALVPDRLSAGGFLDPEAESSHAAAVLAREHGLAPMQLLFTVDAPDGAAGPAARAAGERIVAGLRADDRVGAVASAWTDPTAGLVSRDGRTGLVVAGLRGDDNTAQHSARDLVERFGGERDGVTVAAGGQAVAFDEINAGATRDLAIAEGIAVPLTFLLLIWFLRSAVAAAVPALAGVLAIVGTTAVLFLITLVTELSVFALNIATALGLALAIDYSLLLIGRYREEIARGLPHAAALGTAVRRGGRAVVFSGVIVATALVGLLAFPMAFLRSIGIAGVAVVALSVLITLTVVPALLALLGPRINRRPLREAAPVESTRLYRITRAVQRRPLLCALPALAVLLLAGAPVLDLRVGLPDDRVLPATAGSHAVGDRIRDGFDRNATGTVHLVVTGAEQARLAEYAARLSALPDTAAVTGSAGVFVAGAGTGAPTGGIGADGSAHLAVASALDPYSDAGRAHLAAVRAVPAPGTVSTGGLAQQTADTAAGIARGFPIALAWIALTTAVLLALLTGSLLLPLKALVLNTLSLAATFGALVWVFQQGHLGGLDTEVTGFVVATIPMLLFCVAFGLSMDYEVFLLARFTEEWERSGRSAADVDRAVAIGLARSGRVVTAAAVLMAVVFAGIATSGVAGIRALGVGLVLAVLLDATVVRVVLVPAVMRLAGTANWWLPRALVPLAERARLRE
ncbi:MMPL family transporter [Nocardia sp. NPDC057353]|uniref:MMPL family transporter n=1 Tax=Nocardia sp. NPDC057353 TaxID=3346104 RepID=UPI00362CE86E